MSDKVPIGAMAPARASLNMSDNADQDAWKGAVAIGPYGPTFRGQALEQAFLSDRADVHLGDFKGAVYRVLVLFNLLLLGDWLLIPDRFEEAMLWRAFFYTPLMLLGGKALTRLHRPWREWLCVGLCAVPAALTLWLCVQSKDELAGPHLMAIALLSIACGSALRLRFWMATVIGALNSLFFAVGAMLITTTPPNVNAAAGFLLGVIALFNLYASIQLELDDRRSWLHSEKERQLIQETEIANATLDKLTRFDALTGVANRRHLEEVLEQHWSRSSRGGQPLALLMIDIDCFKRYNDCKGHVDGDACLKAVAGAIRDGLREPGDLLARLGGEEFCVVLPNTALSSAARIAERVRQSVLGLDIPHPDSVCSDRVTVSVGLASTEMDGLVTSKEALLRCADVALYESKRLGRNRVSACQADTASQMVIIPRGAMEPDATSVPAPDVPQRKGTGPALLTLPWTRFEPQVEAAYLSQKTRMGYESFALHLALAIVAFNLFLITDALIVPDAIQWSVWVRLGVFTPSALALLLFVRVRRRWIFSLWPATAIDLLASFAMVGAALCLASIILHSHLSSSVYYHPGFSAILMAGNLTRRIRIRYVLMNTLAVTAIHIATLMAGVGMLDRMSMAISLFVMCSALLVFRGAYLLEADDRTSFLDMERQRRLHERLREVGRHLAKQSSEDPLTGLNNRRAMTQYLEQSLNRLAHDEDTCSVVMMDVDHFKAYNDQYGHAAGDDCLKKIAHAMSHVLRGSDTLVARYGGEEFIAVLSSVEARDALSVAQRLCEAVRALRIPHTGSPAFGIVTISVGVVTSAVDGGTTADGLIERADRALYVAKNGGRNRVVTEPASVDQT